MSQTELVLLEEVGHLPHFTRPEAVVDAVDAAWRQASLNAASI